MIKCAHFTCYACRNEEADTLRADLARVTAERDEAREEVEALRALIREYAPPPVWREADALRARKAQP